jgi:hypothetical protein
MIRKNIYHKENEDYYTEVAGYIPSLASRGFYVFPPLP